MWGWGWWVGKGELDATASDTAIRMSITCRRGIVSATAGECGGMRGTFCVTQELCAWVPVFVGGLVARDIYVVSMLVHNGIAACIG